MNVLLVIARILFAAIFINSGIMHLTKLEAMTGYAKYKKVPAAKLSVVVSGLMILIGGLYIALGIYADLGALLIAIFLIPAALIFHAFWKESDATAKQTEMMAFMKNIALAGGALIVFAMVAKQGGELDFGWVISKAHVALWK